MPYTPINPEFDRQHQYSLQLDGPDDRVVVLQVTDATGKVYDFQLEILSQHFAEPTVQVNVHKVEDTKYLGPEKVQHYDYRSHDRPVGGVWFLFEPPWPEPATGREGLDTPRRAEAARAERESLRELDRKIEKAQAEKAMAESEVLHAAIRKHRDYRGDDRCWMDDEELYAVLPEGYAPPERDTTVELKLCEKFIASRRNPRTEYVSPQRRIDELEAQVRELQGRLDDSRSAAEDRRFD